MAVENGGKYYLIETPDTGTGVRTSSILILLLAPRNVGYHRDIFHTIFFKFTLNNTSPTDQSLWSLKFRFQSNFLHVYKLNKRINVEWLFLRPIKFHFLDEIPKSFDEHQVQFN